MWTFEDLPQTELKAMALEKCECVTITRGAWRTITSQPAMCSTNYVTDHDAELLCQLVPLEPEPQVGGMTPEVTAIHTALLHVVGAMREAWEINELCGGL